MDFRAENTIVDKESQDRNRTEIEVAESAQLSAIVIYPDHNFSYSSFLNFSKLFFTSV